ncbi:MAG: hypothetical protein MZU95_14200 [Desulfomicrobium escambiense]|nr:hypothetical protein [Desulfomicrobium escambiense]
MIDQANGFEVGRRGRRGRPLSWRQRYRARDKAGAQAHGDGPAGRRRSRVTSLAHKDDVQVAVDASGAGTRRPG